VNGEVALTANAGRVEPAVQAEFPGLRLDWVEVAVASGGGRSPVALRRRLRLLSDRYRGADVVAMRTWPIPHAYRAFFHQIGLDPDTTRIPSEQAAVDRLLHGQFRSHNLVDDALLIALLETGVPVWGLDAESVDGSGLGIRASRTGERLGSGADGVSLAPDRLVVADARRVHALLFGDVASGHRVGHRTSRIVLFAVGVDGVPRIHLEEALWQAVDALATRSRT
jgi:DNA/RNA-binding domain of Phe-tRNA-synthetase-like protein